MSDYPVGRCYDETCHYPEPHRHGLNCDKTCECVGVGAETAPLTEDDWCVCDWGGCPRPAVATRRSQSLDGDFWLSVCSWHAGWDAEESSPAT